MAERIFASLGVSPPAWAQLDHAVPACWTASAAQDACLGSVVMHLTGKLIAIEGIDQAGKHTVCSWLKRELQEHQIHTELVGFPDYSTPLGEVIAQFLRDEIRFPIEVRQHLYAANRWERAAEIRQWLESGYAVIIDRYSASNVAYGVAQGLDLEWVQGLERGLPAADITILLDIPPEVSLRRKPHQRDSYESRLDLLAEARAAYHILAREPNWITVDADADRESVRAQVLTALQQRFP